MVERWSSVTRSKRKVSQPLGTPQEPPIRCPSFRAGVSWDPLYVLFLT